MNGLIRFTERRGTLQAPAAAAEAWVNPEAIDCLRVISTGAIMVLRSGQTLYLVETVDEVIATLEQIAWTGKVQDT